MDNEQKIVLEKLNKFYQDKLRELELFYLQNMVEDPIDGTLFDCNILDAVKRLKTQGFTITNN